MKTEDINQTLTDDIKKATDNLKHSTSGNPGKRLGYWLAGGAVVAAGAALAFGAYRNRQQAQKAINPNTVARVDVNRYMGRWFEIARIPHRFEKDATDVQAFYTLEKNGKVRVENYCMKHGKTKVARGSAKVVDKNSNAKLKVSFFWPFEGDYWILGLGDNYEWALVGGPTGDYLWILSRTPQLDNGVRDRILALAREKGYDTNRLSFTPQEISNIQKVIERESQDGNTVGNEAGVYGQPQNSSGTQPGIQPGVLPETQPEVLYPDIE